MEEEDIYMTTFRTHHGYYEFTVMSFSLPIYSSHFNAFWTRYLKLIYGSCTDFIWWHSGIWPLPGSTQKVPKIGVHTAQATLIICKKSKCYFAEEEIEYLDISSLNKRSKKSLKSRGHADLASSNLYQRLQGFLGLTGYYWNFICNYGTISKALTDMLKRKYLNGSRKQKTHLNC